MVRKNGTAATAAAKTETAGKPREIRVENFGSASFGLLTVTLEGTAPLLQHAFGTKMRTMIEEKQQGRAAAARSKAVRDPESDFLESLHCIGRRPKSLAEIEKSPTKFRWGVPAAAFKAAIVRTAGLNDLMPMTEARAAFHVRGDEMDRSFVQLHTPTHPVMHTAMVRIQQTSDVRYRALYEAWSVKLEIEFHARRITAEQLTALLVDAGVGNGVGEWRPAGRSSSGTFGTWKVTSASVQLPND